jgi:2-polyprenyl-3-methyl-5-hydroxy-6-metoxy-1,4-benzoquinol methylase
MQGDFVPFCDPNLLNLDRTKFALNQAIEKQPRHVLSVGGGEGTLAKEILTNTTAHLSVSELQEGRSAVVEALDLIFPGRVGTVERFDVEKNDVQQFDFIECLEVIEHVSDPVLLLTNLLTSLEVGGILCLTTPNAEEWVEQKNLDDLYTEGAWLHHVNAFTQETLVWCVQRAVKRINAHDYSMEFHPGHKQIMAKIVRTK